MADVVTLVPWRGGDAARERSWDVVRPTLEDLGHPLYTGDSRGKWARAAACNAAAAVAGDWDIALVTDADTILEPTAVHRAIERVSRTKAAARPHDRRWMLSLAATKVLMRHGIEALKPEHLRGSAPGGGALVIHREAWERVGGYDERFIGWGYEDSAMNISLAVTSGWELSEGQSYHLWHPIPNTTTSSARANRALLDAHRAMNARAIRQRSREAGFDLNTVL